MNNHKNEIQVFAIVFFVVAVVLRFMPHMHNVAAMGALGMFVGCYWSARMGILMSIAAMGISDLLGQFFAVPSMGFYNPWLMLTVYSAIGCSALVGKLLHNRINWSTVPLGAIAATALFFLITNFASWVDPAMPYPKTLAGLVECYVAAIPFVKFTLYGNLLFSALFFGSYVAMTAPLNVSQRQASPK